MSMYFYYFICSKAWRKKSYWRSVWNEMQTFVLITLSLVLLLNAYKWNSYFLLLLLAPAIYYVYNLIRPSVYCKWQTGATQHFCVVYFDKSSYLRKNGILLIGTNKKIKQISKIRRCRDIPSAKTLIVKIADSGNYMLFNVDFPQGLLLGTLLKHTNSVYCESCFISNNMLSFVYANGKIIWMPNVTEYKVMSNLPEHEQETIIVSDFPVAINSLSHHRKNKSQNCEAVFCNYCPNVRYLALKQSDNRETFLCINFSDTLVKKILQIDGLNVTEMLKCS